MQFVVVAERDGQVLQRRRRVRLGHPRNVIALHRFDEALSHPVALRTSEGVVMGFKPIARENVSVSSAIAHQPRLVKACDVRVLRDFFEVPKSTPQLHRYCVATWFRRSAPRS
jgi:hypothetical protein